MTGELTNINPDEPFYRPVKNIAVLLYGQWRVGDFLLDYIKEFYKDRVDVNIDIFAGIKTSSGYNHSKSITETVKDYYTQEHVEHQLSKLDATKYTIIDEDKDAIHTQLKYSRLYTGLFEAHDLKCIHEIQNSIEYDLVFFQRSDMVIHPINYIDYVVNWYNAVTYNTLFNQFITNFFYGGFICAENIPSYKFGPGSPQIQDSFLWGTNMAIDMMISNLYDFPTDYDFEKKRTYDLTNPRQNICAHNGFAYAINQASLPVTGSFGFSLDSRTSDEKMLAFHDDASQYEKIKEHQFSMALIRPHFDLTADPFKREDLKIWIDQWTADQKL